MCHFFNIWTLRTSCTQLFLIRCDEKIVFFLGFRFFLFPVHFPCNFDLVLTLLARHSLNLLYVYYQYLTYSFLDCNFLEKEVKPKRKKKIITEKCCNFAFKGLLFLDCSRHSNNKLVLNLCFCISKMLKNNSVYKIAHL